MKIFRQSSIQNRLFLVIVAVLSINILVIILFGNTFLEQYYIMNKKQELKGYQEQIQSGLSKPGSAQLEAALGTCSENNVTVMLYDRSNGQVMFSSAEPSEGESSRIDIQKWINQAASENIFSELEEENPIIVAEDNSISNSIYLYAKLSQNTYLFMETPLSYIAATAQTATQFFLLISILTLLIGILVTHFVAKRMASPIQQIEATAEHIAALDFRTRCNIHTGDEIESLAKSVNAMADELEKNIGLLKSQLEQEEKTNRIHRDFVANVSHDFKTPISLISAYSEAIKDGNCDDVSEACNILIEQSERMNHMVNQLLTLSQLESGIVEFNVMPFCINDLIYTTVQNFKIMREREQISVTFECDQEYIVYGDYPRVEQVFTNLFENAMKYVDEKKQILIRLEEKDAKVRVHVFNTHPPLPQEALQNVFVMFYKEDFSREKTKSYGIGLAIVKTIMQAHEQQCGVYNEKDGVNFWFELEEVPGTQALPESNEKEEAER